MGITPQAPAFVSVVENGIAAAWAEFTGMFRLNPRHQGLTPEQALLETPGIDPHFIPRAPMNNADLDLGLLSTLSGMGLKRGKEITAKSHPEYYAAWVELCRRGGLKHIPQLVLVESKIPNAGMVHGEEAGYVTTGLLKRLTFREAIAVQGHEVGHEVSNHMMPRALAITALGGTGLYLGNKFAENGGIGAMIKEVENPSLLRRFAHWIFRPTVTIGRIYIAAGIGLGTVAAKQLTVHPTELDADRKGAMISGDPEGLISALSKLEDSRTSDSWLGKLARMFHFVISGYPSTENRIAKLRHIAQTMPRDVVPVYASVPTLPQTALTQGVPAVITTPTPSPALQISGVSQAERVNAPVAEPTAAL